MYKIYQTSTFLLKSIKIFHKLVNKLYKNSTLFSFLINDPKISLTVFI